MHSIISEIKYPEKGIFHGPLAYQATGRQYLTSHCSDITRHCHLIERSALLPLWSELQSTQPAPTGTSKF